MIRLPAILLSALALALVPSFSRAADDAEAKMMELMKPGKEHAAMAKLVGTWDTTVKAWMKPDAPAMESHGTAVFSVILDGHFVQEDFSSEMMGQPFKGIGIDGFDRARGLYTAIWMDSMSTSSAFETGTSKDDGKTIEFTGETGDCMAPGKSMKIRSVVTHRDDDHFNYVMYQTHDGGKEEKGLEIEYVRRKEK